jgi:hypothetical protein
VELGGVHTDMLIDSGASCNIMGAMVVRPGPTGIEHIKSWGSLLTATKFNKYYGINYANK